MIEVLGQYLSSELFLELFYDQGYMPGIHESSLSILSVFTLLMPKNRDTSIDNSPETHWLNTNK